MKLKPANDRGFLLGEFTDLYGAKCSIQKSSLADEDAIWLGVSDPDPHICPGNGTGWHPYKLPKGVQVTTRMHLNQEQAAQLIPLLKHFVATGELPVDSSKCRH